MFNAQCLTDNNGHRYNLKASSKTADYTSINSLQLLKNLLGEGITNWKDLEKSNILKIDDVGATFNGKVTYHDSCAALRECNTKTEPRKLLSKVKGLELIEMNDVETCCGFGGSFAVKFEPISIAMGDQKTTNAAATGAEYIVSTDMSCLMHIDGCLTHNHSGLKVLHLADVLASEA